MARSTVAIASLGGTITMTSGDKSTGLTPSLSVNQLVEGIPHLKDSYEIISNTIETIPGASLSFDNIMTTLDWAEMAIKGGAEGAVVVQGTDTIEETAYLLDLFWAHDEPLIVTGAMRSPQQAGADGPANLLSSVLTAISPDSRGRGVLVVLNDEVHGASRVQKGDSISTNSFRSTPFGPLARIHEFHVTYANRANRWPALERPELGSWRSTFIWKTFLGDNGDILRAIDRSAYDGLVIESFGAGHVSFGLANVLSEIAKDIPVVLTSRASTSVVLKSTYGFPGSEKDLIGRGLIPAGWLTPLKARLLLCSLLSVDTPRAMIGSIIMSRGDMP